MRHLKRLGLATIAAAAVMALVGVASAAAEFHTSAAEASIRGAQVEGEGHVLTIEETSIACNNAEFTGAGAGTTFEVLTLHPEYSECTLFGFANGTIDTTGCNLAFNDETTTFALTGCEEMEHNGVNYGPGITFHVQSVFNTTCLVLITAQEGLNGVAYENMNGTAGPLTITTNTTNLSYHVLTSTGLCPLTPGATGTAEYEGSTEVTANEGASEIWVE